MNGLIMGAILIVVWIGFVLLLVWIIKKGQKQVENEKKYQREIRKSPLNKKFY